MKLQTKITLLFFVIGTAGIVLLNTAIFYFVSEFSFEDFFKRLEARVNLAAEINIDPDEHSAAYQEVRSRYLEKLENERDYVIKMAPGKETRFKKPLSIPDKFYTTVITRGRARYSEKNRFYVGVFLEKKDAKYMIIVAAEDPYGFKELELLKKVLLIVFGVSTLLTFIAGKVFSYYTIKPVRTIISSVQRISATNLHLRLDEVKGKDEIAELVLTFNNMLTRLETAFETQNNFVSNASHELRTPLTIIIAETELLLASVPNLPEVKTSAGTILSEAEKLGHILTSLLGLAQTGFDGKRQDWDNIRVDELVLNVVDAVKKIDSESIIDLNFSALPADGSLLNTKGNVNLLQLAISNILLNACKYSRNNPVEIKITSENDKIVITVSDHGIGIPKEEQQHIFEPFFRASNTGQFEGHGIGLPLTLNIIRLHHGAIGIRSEEQIGTEIQIILPVNSN